MNKKNKINTKFISKYRDLKKEIEQRYMILMVLIFFSFLIILLNLYSLQITNHEYYAQRLEQINRRIVYGPSAPRGRIYDRNHRLLVDNEAVKTITYQKERNTSREQEIAMAYFVSEMIELDYNLSIERLKEFWVMQNASMANQKITSEEWQLLSERRIKRDDINRLKLKRINETDLEIYNEADKKAIYIYNLMNQGYWFSEKIIKNNNVTEQEYAIISENLNQLPGFAVKLDWQRVYLYDDIFKPILGRVSKQGLPAELKNYFLAKGYNLDDRVGVTNIELQFEEYLRGTKNKYEIIGGKRNLIEAGTRGNDIVLTIDIELQKEIAQIVETELINAKNDRNTEYLDTAFVIIQQPQTGEILAMVGKKLYKSDEGWQTYDFTMGITTTSVVAGSSIKGASQIVAYNNNALEKGERRNDRCIKIAATPLKCSWTYLGFLDDITALQKSSNTYQFQSAIKIGNGNYQYNQPLYLDPNAFSIYREGFAQFGLGSLTQIELPNENLGYRGSSLKSGHLLDFSIGQYDTYTPIQIAQYIATIANDGYRLKPLLLKAVYQPTNPNLTNVIYNQNSQVLNIVETDFEYLQRVKTGFEAVMQPGGTGLSFAPRNLKIAGKTGTSESFIDTTGDGMVDTLTLSNSFVGYGPFDNPIASFTVLTPSFYHQYGSTRTRSLINRKISYQVIEKFFEMYR